MSTKECPSCGAEVPNTATRCKECFHDFSSEQPTTGMSMVGPLIVLASVAAMAVIGSIILLFIYMQPVEVKTLVDEDTRSIIWTTKYRTSIETDRVMFDQVVKVEHAGSGGTFQVLAVTTDGDRKVIMEADSPLENEARSYARLMDKPFENKDPTADLLHKK